MSKIKIILFIVVSLGITFLAYRLRVRDFATIPLPGQSMDEYSNSWVGLSLIRLGFPIGMSGMTGYGGNDNRYINVDRVFQSTANGNPYTLNYPWFDHPPLMGLVTGGFAYLRGARVFEDTVAVVIRKPVVIMGATTVILTGILALTLFGWQTSLGSTLLYATIPLVVIQSRFIQAENGLIIFFLLSLIFLTLFLKKQKYSYLFLASVLAGIGTLFKLSGVAIYLTTYLCLLLQEKDKLSKIKDLIFFTCIALPITSLFIIYGYVMGWSTFVNVLSDNSSRFYGLGMAAIQNLWLETRITHGKTLTDAWPMTLWISFLIYQFQKRKPLELILPIAIVSYLITYLFFGSWPYGWYTIPFWPFLTIIFIHHLAENSKKYQSLFVNFLLLSFPITQNLTRFIDIRNFQTYSSLWRTMFTVLILTLFYLSIKNSSKTSPLNKVFVVTLFLFSIYLNIRFLGTINIDNWLRLN